MRAAPVARALDAPLIHPEKFSDSGFWDAIVVTKYWPRDVNLRARCGRLIFDPLDCWESTKPDAAPADFWRWTWGQLEFDTIIATSPAAAVSMNQAIGEKVRIVLSPHAADPRIDATWHDQSGPIVYAGGERFIASQADAIADAARRIGRQWLFRFDRDCWQALQGAAMSLCLRLPPTDTEINRLCKPQVKAANAVAAGAPVLSSDHPCFTSLYGSSAVVQSGESWDAALLRSLHATRSTGILVTVDQHIEIVRGLLQ